MGEWNKRDEPEVLMDIGGVPRNIDATIADLVKALNDGGLRTIASCSGHGFRPGSIILADGRELLILPNYEAARQADKFWPLDINGEPQGGTVADGEGG